MFYIIVNPAARSGKGLEVWHQAEAYFQFRNIRYQVYFTRYPGHGKKLARMLAVKIRNQRLLVIGGDGTIDEVVNGLPLDHRIRLSYLPVGSGNDFARGMKLPRDPERALRYILNRKNFRHMDLGILHNGKRNYRFAISAGFGYDAAVCDDIARTSFKKLLNKLHLGRLVYAVTAVKLLFRFQPFDLDVVLDEKEKRHFTNVYFAAGMNLPYEGGGFRFCPNADCQDGKLDYLIVHNLPKWKVLLLFPTAYFALHTRISGITILRGTSLELHSSHPQVLHHDGEYGGISDTAIFRVKKQALDFL